ncbi:MAG: hypothetical protein AABM67_20990 [Acidobacteriota bacterium]
MEPKIISTEHMNKEQLRDWSTLFDGWVRDEFRPTLKTLAYKQDCVQCGDIYFVTQFHVDQEGYVREFKIVREEIDCRSKTVPENDALREKLTSNFTGWIFPPSLRGVIVEARMGEVTRC